MANFFFKALRFLWRSIFGGKEVDDHIYAKWLKRNLPSNEALAIFRNQQEEFDFRPLVSVIIPVYNAPMAFLQEAIDSVKCQVYPNWEICMVDDASTDKELQAYLKQLTDSDDRLKINIRKENGHISACSNDAVDLASGEYLAFLDQDDLLTPDALFHMVLALNQDEKAILLYSDEDKIDRNGERLHPHFKPDYAPHNLLSRNYMGHLVMVQKEAFIQAGKFRLGFEGSQDYDLWLRVVELEGKIAHVPKVLYQWRMHSASTAVNEDAKSYAFENGVKSLNEALARRGIKGSAQHLDGSPGIYRINYRLESSPLISIIIPTKNNTDVLGTCLESLFTRTSYVNFEVILLDNNSDEESLFALLEKWKEAEPTRFKVLKQTYAFNFSKLMNSAAKVAKGEYLVLLNNDTEVIQADWLEVMLGHAMQKNVGAVGVKLLFPNNTVQHAGVVIGIQGLAGHTFVAADRNEPGYHYYLKAVSNYSAVTAACLMVSSRLFNEVGGFDEALAVEYNDVDFCLKLIEAGYYNLFIPHVELYHYESLTRGHPHANRKVYDRHKKEVKYYTSKWAKYIENDPFYNPNLTRITTYFEPNIHG